MSRLDLYSHSVIRSSSARLQCPTEMVDNIKLIASRYKAVFFLMSSREPGNRIPEANFLCLVSLSWLSKAFQQQCLATDLKSPFVFVAAPGYWVPTAGHDDPWLTVLDVYSSRKREYPCYAAEHVLKWHLAATLLWTIKWSSVSQGENVSVCIWGVGNVKTCHPSKLTSRQADWEGRGKAQKEYWNTLSIWQLYENEIFPTSLKTKSEINYFTLSRLKFGAYSYAQLFSYDNVNLNILQEHFEVYLQKHPEFFILDVHRELIAFSITGITTILFYKAIISSNIITAVAPRTDWA